MNNWKYLHINNNNNNKCTVNIIWQKRPHRRRTWTVQSFSPGGRSMCSHLIHAAVDLPESIHPKRHLDRFSRFRTAHSRLTLYFTMGFSFPRPLKIAPSHEGSGSHLIHGSLGLLESTTQTASRSVSPFLNGSRSWQTDRPTDRTR